MKTDNGFLKKNQNMCCFLVWR